MKLPNWLKIIWWLAITGFFAYLLSQRYTSIMGGDTSATDIVIFLIFVALFSIPLFQEVDFFGVRLKKEIDTLRTEFKENIVNLRSDIQNTINMRTEISHQIYLTLPKDSELPSIEKGIKPYIAKSLKERGIRKPPTITAEQLTSENIRYLFSIRYAIESELRRIYNVSWEPLVKEGYFTIPQILHELYNFRKINPQIHDAIREVNAICSASIHGKTVSEKAVKFVRDVAPGLLASLEAMETIDWTLENIDLKKELKRRQKSE